MEKVTIQSKSGSRASLTRRSFFKYALLSLFLTISIFLFPSPRLSKSIRTDSNSQAEWADDTWPLRPPTSWDISTDFPYPRLLTYTVHEGTWLRLDVHPTSGDIVFDMAGDLYCLPAHVHSPSFLYSEPSTTRARPVLFGVPWDSDPHFAPDGNSLVFRSDAEFGVENIWAMPWHGCDAMDIRPILDGSEGLYAAMEVQAEDEDLLARGVSESAERRNRRLIREGRLDAHRVTNETYRWVSDARFHPSGQTVIATKWYTSSRSLGAGEGWEYSVPTLSSKKVEAGSGTKLVGRTLPAGWGAQQYGDQQVGPEQFVWRGNDTLVYAQNVQDVDGAFTYSKDVHKGIYAIFSRNLTTGKTETLVDAFPGGASRPELSRDGRTLAFVRRVRDKEALVLKDLETGTTHNVWHGLSYDLSAVSAPMGTYPSFAFTPADDAVIIWAAGQIYHVPLTTNVYGERIASLSHAPRPLRFEARIEKRLAETRTGHAGKEILRIETKGRERVYAFKELSVDEAGQRVVFQAAGATYVQRVGERAGAVRIPVLDEGAAYYTPSFVSGTEDLVLHARWSNEEFSALEIANVSASHAYTVVGLPRGRFRTPVVCAGKKGSRTRRLVVVKTGGDLLTGDVIATAGAGLYVGDMELPVAGEDTERVVLSNLRFVPSEIDAEDVLKMSCELEGGRLLVHQSARVFSIDLDTSEQDTVVAGRMSTEIVASPDYIAFIDTYNVYVAEAKKVAEDELVWSRPGNATRGLARVSLDGGHDIMWSGDGKQLFWFLGPYLHSLEVSKLQRCASAIEKDCSTFGIGCTKGLLEYEEVVVEHPTAVSLLKQDAAAASPGIANADVLVITNATILTMETGSFIGDLITDGVLVSRGGLIEAVGGVGDIAVPSGAAVINAQGGLVVPGFIDVHAHWGGFDTLYPATSWELETFLAYGVTTLHNPSSDNVDGFVERSRVESGQLIGPRIFHTGNIIYGAAEPAWHQDIVDMDEARSALVRIKAEGGPASFSYKNYNLPSRAARQRLLLAAKNLSMLCVPEGGMNQDWDLTYIIDGMTTVEHALPVSTLYEDILTLYALSGTGATPTHVVNYGGAWGEQLVWAHVDVPNDAKLRRFTRHDILEGLSESTARPKNSYALFNTSASIANMVQMGLRTHIGAHGEPPLGLNYHAEMFFTQQGGLSNYEVLKAATSSAALTLGLSDALGTLSPGKFADFVVYPPSVDLLSEEGDILQSLEIRYVARGGRMWDAESMVEVWPMKGKKQVGPRINPE